MPPHPPRRRRRRAICCSGGSDSARGSSLLRARGCTVADELTPTTAGYVSCFRSSWFLAGIPHQVNFNPVSYLSSSILQLPHPQLPRSRTVSLRCRFRMLRERYPLQKCCGGGGISRREDIVEVQILTVVVVSTPSLLDDRISSKHLDCSHHRLLRRSPHPQHARHIYETSRLDEILDDELCWIAATVDLTP